jgi:DNA processing protein
MDRGASAALPGDDEFPVSLIGIPDEPLHLFFRGRLPGKDAFCVAVVGTRVPTPTGRRFAEEAARSLAGAGATVVSGLARGIDGFAHRAALEAPPAGNPLTIAVLPCGLDLCYPREHVHLLRRIEERGAAITEFPPFSRPFKHHFLRRNRLLSGLSRLVVVVEARERSGARITAKHAMEQGREVAALPGDVYSPQSEGTNGLIFEGSAPIVSLKALMKLVESMGLAGAAGGPIPIPFPGVPSGVPAEVAMLFSALGPRPTPCDAIAEATGLLPHRIMALLLELELQGLVRRYPGGYGLLSTEP